MLAEFDNKESDNVDCISRSFWNVILGGDLERALQAKQIVEEPGVGAIVGASIGGKNGG